MEKEGTYRAFNFSAGPSCLPIEILQKAQKDFISYQGSGVSVLEMSHRSKDFTTITQNAEKNLRNLLEIPENYKIFFLQGGASLQFSCIPLNLLKDKKSANYLTTGSWSTLALKEAQKYCDANEVAPASKGEKLTIEPQENWKTNNDGAYFHYCMNETISGVELHNFPYEKVGDMILVSDMSSNFCSRPIDVSKYGLIYAGVQKNVGPAGVTVVIVREDLIGHELPITPTMCSYKTHASAPCHLYNTPCSFGIYMCGLNFEHMLNQGGIKHYEELAIKRSQMLYEFIDGSSEFYTNPVEVQYRSRVNIPFRVKKDETLEKKFIAEAAKGGLLELTGHRSVGGCRASLYNAMPIEGVEALISFMKKFMQENS